MVPSRTDAATSVMSWWPSPGRRTTAEGVNMSRRLRDEFGATAVEYALIIAAVALLLIPIVISLQSVLEGVLHDSCVSTAEQNAPGPLSDEASTKC